MVIATDFKSRRSVFAKENGFAIDDQSFANFSTLALDGTRSRPRYFDGRFLTGKDLSRDQDYVRQRQDDLARASGAGVIAGLDVKQIDATDLTIGDGFGVTASGDLVVILALLKVSVSNLVATETLDASFGIRIEPAAPFQKRTGLFLLALRPVEYTANPIAAYPTSVTGQRRMENGDIIEATAVTLIPFPVGGNPLDLRASAARQIFLEGSARGLPVEALPLAMIALNQGSIQWIDVNMVRRENRGASTMQSALGGRSRALAEAHVLQYQEQLQWLTRDGVSAFAASSAFSVLPPVGQMPLACLTHDGFGFKESFFPPGLSVDVSFIPTDEIAALVEESLPLAPINLSANPADMAGTGVVILIPLPRADVRNAIGAFGSGEAHEATPIPQIRFWMENLHALNVIRQPVNQPQEDPQAGSWQKYRAFAEKQGHGLVWFARRRSVAYRSSLEGIAQSAEESVKRTVEAKINALMFGTTDTEAAPEATKTSSMETPPAPPAPVPTTGTTPASPTSPVASPPPPPPPPTPVPTFPVPPVAVPVTPTPGPVVRPRPRPGPRPPPGFGTTDATEFIDPAVVVGQPLFVTPSG